MVDLRKVEDARPTADGGRPFPSGFVPAARLFAGVAVLLAATGCGLAWWRWYAPLPRWDLLLTGYGAVLCGLLRTAALAAADRWPGHRPGGAPPRDARPGARRAGRAAATALRIAGWMLVYFAAGVVLLFPFHGGQLPDRQARLYYAGAAFGEGTVVVAPGRTEPDRDDDGTVSGYTADLTVRVTTAKGPLELAVADAVTSSEPKAGQRLPVLYAPGRPGLGGVIDVHRDLARVADTWALPAEPVGVDVLCFVTPLMLLLGAALGSSRSGAHMWPLDPRRAARRLAVLTVPLLCATPLLLDWRNLLSLLGLGVAFLWLLVMPFAQSVRD
ncbi:hypothetical protein GCM10009760_15020 [Kitasatospora kazusensis]|uniref:Uncharacterized protein n=1 Tax=Kitasatospora kazusensis TaxID=407974 RepID=A0ABP5KQE1_9ACTN